MKLDQSKGFSIVEVIAALSIVMIAVSCVVWNFPRLKKLGTAHLVIHRAAMLSTAKEAYLREKGSLAFTNYQEGLDDEAKFEFVKRYLPYTDEATNLAKYTPEGFKYEMGSLGSKVAIMDQSTGKQIHY